LYKFIKHYIDGTPKREAALLIGGPPCQPFSKSGFWATGESKRLKDPRAATLDEYLRILEETLPHAFLLENVAGIAYRGKSEGLEYLKDYTVLGTRIEAHKQIGNAVPSALAELIALKIRARYFDEPHLETATPTLLPTKSASVPKARTPEPVPEKYLEYIGEHQAHPGTGKGYGAQRTRSSAHDSDGLPHLQRR